MKRITTIVCLSFSLTAFANKKESGNTPKVFLEKFKQTEVYQYGKYYGKVRPKILSKIYSPIAGTMDQLLVKPGERVKKGQVIGKIKAIDVANEMRPFPLKAPLSGIISGNIPRIGQFINRHQEVVTIYKNDKYISTINIAFDDAKNISNGHSVQVIIDKQNYNGKVLSIGENLDQFTGTVETLIEIQPKKNKIRPGFISENIIKYDIKQAFAIPRKYIHRMGKEQVLFTTKESNDKKSKKLHPIKVEVEGRFKDLLKVKTQSELKELNIVTKSTLKHLSEGTEVEVIQNKKEESKMPKEKKQGRK